MLFGRGLQRAKQRIRQKTKKTRKNYPPPFGRKRYKTFSQISSDFDKKGNISHVLEQNLSRVGTETTTRENKSSNAWQHKCSHRLIFANLDERIISPQKPSFVKPSKTKGPTEKSVRPLLELEIDLSYHFLWNDPIQTVPSEVINRTIYRPAGSDVTSTCSLYPPCISRLPERENT